MWEVVKNLQEAYEDSNTLDVEVAEKLEFIKNPTNTLAMVREIIASVSLRQARNETSHPFSHIASHAMRESALALYSSLLIHDFTEVFSSYYLIF